MAAIEGAPRIVRRRAKRHGAAAHHGGSWKIAYADFITAMMAFFLVMWLLTLVPKENLTGLAEYFRTPLRAAIEKGPQSNNSQTLIQGGGTDPSAAKGEVRRSAETPARAQAASDSERRDAQRLENFRRRLDEAIEASPRLRAYRPQLRIDITSEGLRIQIVDSENRPMFATGSAQVEPHMRTILRELGPILNEVPNRISLSGHTDAHPYSLGERAYSNWELSSERANASRRELIAGGMAEDKVMRVLGMGSSMPLLRDDPLADVNRRISLVLLSQRAQQRIETENATASSARAINGAADAQLLLEERQEAPAAGSPQPPREGAADAAGGANRGPAQ
ncbi:MAG: flagellar motor protein MotB [Comamonas sp.]